jgi:elongation factor Ts
VNCETDFVARTLEFQEFVHDIAMHIVGLSPWYVSVADVPTEVVAEKRAEYRAEMEGQGKSAQVLDRIVEGRMRKFYEDVCLLEQPFIRDEDRTVGTLVTELIAKLGENIVIRRFARLEVGE